MYDCVWLNKETGFWEMWHICRYTSLLPCWASNCIILYRTILNCKLFYTQLQDGYSAKSNTHSVSYISGFNGVLCLTPVIFVVLCWIFVDVFLDIYRESAFCVWKLFIPYFIYSFHLPVVILPKHPVLSVLSSWIYTEYGVKEWNLRWCSTSHLRA